ncbi:hypothetical protein KY333_02645 [Candidatus Woesearchaeota archaeon]|nr:hypothetical protein [Candidatus Woesearchaeota archaeon]MBW2993960.1 hypothetical protein [Candidatus Woesearchaeota archaeon]
MVFNSKGKILSVTGKENQVIIIAEMQSGFLKGPIKIETDAKYYAENMAALGLELPTGAPWSEEKKKKSEEAKGKIINHKIDIIIE